MTQLPPEDLADKKIGLTQLLARPIQSANLAKNTSDLAQERAQSLREEDTILLFRIGGERFALPANSVLQFQAVQPLNAPAMLSRPPPNFRCRRKSVLL